MEKATDSKEKEKRVDRASDRREKSGKTTNRQVKERARLEMFLTCIGLLILA